MPPREAPAARFSAICGLALALPYPDAMRDESEWGATTRSGFRLRPADAVAPRPIACRRCRAPADRRAKFCVACGMVLAHAEHRQVTVILTDICGFTAMSERLDPEQVREILDAGFAVMLDATHRFGGTVNQFLGDGVMAVFDGTGGSHDHAARAVATALSIQSGLRPLAESLHQAYGLEFRVRIAVHTGLVTVGTIGGDLRDDYVPRGETTSEALRLLHLAPGEGVVVSAPTRGLLDDRFDFEELGTAPASGASSRPLAFLAGARN